MNIFGVAAHALLCGASIGQRMALKIEEKPIPGLNVFNIVYNAVWMALHLACCLLLE